MRTKVYLSVAAAVPCVLVWLMQLFGYFAYGQRLNLDWIQPVAGDAFAFEEGSFVRLDAAGHVYLVGRYNSSKFWVRDDMSIGNPVEEITNPADAGIFSTFILCYDINGQFQWAATEADASPTAAVADVDGLYVAYPGRILKYALADGAETTFVGSLPASIHALHIAGSTLWAAGIFTEQFSINSTTFDPADGVGIVLEYDLSNADLLGGRQFGIASSQLLGGASLRLKAIGQSSAGELYVAGELDSGPLAQASFVFANQTIAVNEDEITLFALRYDATGTPNYSWQFTADKDDGSGSGVLLTQLAAMYVIGNDVYLAASYYSSDNQPPTLPGASGPLDFLSAAFLVKYDNGDSYAWHKTLNHSPFANEANPVSLYVDATGTSYVSIWQGFEKYDDTGALLNSAFLAYGIAGLVVAESQNVIVVFLNNNSDVDLHFYDGSSFSLLSSFAIGLRNNEQAMSLAADEDGNSYTVGFFESNRLVFSNQFTLSGEIWSGFLFKKDRSGNLVWARRVGERALVYPLAVAYHNNVVYVSGLYTGDAFDELPALPASELNAFVVAYSASDGSALWHAHFGGDDLIEFPTTMTVNSQQELYVAGYFTGTTGESFSFGNSTLTLNGLTDFFLLRYNAVDGTEISGTVLNTGPGPFGGANTIPTQIVTNDVDELWVITYTDATTLTFGSQTYTNPGMPVASTYTAILHYESDLSEADFLIIENENGWGAYGQGIAVLGQELFITTHIYSGAPKIGNTTYGDVNNIASGTWVVRYNWADGSVVWDDWLKGILLQGVQYRAGQLASAGLFYSQVEFANQLFEASSMMSDVLLVVYADNGNQLAGYAFQGDEAEEVRQVTWLSDSEIALFVNSNSELVRGNGQDIIWYNSGSDPASLGSDFFVTSLSLQYQVTFLVFDEDNNPIENASIDVANQLLQTDANGVATIFLSNGTYNYTVTATGFLPLSGTLQVQNSDITLTLELEAVYWVTFRVLYNNVGISGVRIDIDNETLTTDAAGEARIALPNGTYTYSVSNTGADYNAVPDGQVTVANADVTIAIVLTRNPLGVDTGIDALVEVYPNPVSHLLKIRAHEGFVMVRLLDVQGRVLYHSDTAAAEHTIDVYSYKPGLYILEVEGDGFRRVNRILKQ